MTRCEDLNRWLDEGMPAEGAGSERAHAASCATCAEAIAAFEAMERTLALPPLAIPEGAAFTTRVMERIRGASPLPILETPRAPWWIVMVSEPGFAVAVAAAAFLLLTPVTVRVYASQSGALPLTVVLNSLATQFGATLAGWFGPTALVEHLSPLSRAYVLIGFAPLLAWAGLWTFGAVERLVRNLPARRE